MTGVRSVKDPDDRDIVTRVARRAACDRHAQPLTRTAHEPLIRSGTVAEVPLAGLSFGPTQHVSGVAPRHRDDVPADAADPPAPACHGDGRENRPTGTAPEGIVPSRAQLRIAAAGCSVLCTRPYHLSKVALILGPYVHFTAAELGRFAIKRRPSGWRSGPSGSDRPSDDGGTPR